MPSASEALAERLRDGGPVRIAGARTKAGWGRPVPDLEPLDTTALVLVAGNAHAQFPSKPIRVLVPFGAGSSTSL